ncbi:Formate/nitrite transporter-domain-containing protein [Hyaloraphidium curvatum]|nr:Formate/nitrite transporter-domain-containing protein [Hyaloraphidium curvatum]
MEPAPASNNGVDVKPHVGLSGATAVTVSASFGSTTGSVAPSFVVDPLTQGAPKTARGRWQVATYTTPHDTFEALLATSVTKVNHSPWETVGHAFLAGAYIGIGGLFSLVCGCLPGLAQSNPGLQRLIFGGVFPIGLLLIVVTGAELFTSNVLVFSAWMDSRIPALRCLWNLALVWVMNFVGALWLAGMVYWSQVLSGPYLANSLDYFGHKVSQPTDVAFCKGIMCNWLVALAMYCASSAHDLPGKAVGVWPPIAAFVAIGFDHCVANMFFLPLGLFLGADYNAGQMLYRNILPVTAGNMIGSMLVSVVYSFLERKTRWQKKAVAPVPERSCTAHMAS